eukprot:g40761.t1
MSTNAVRHEFKLNKSTIQLLRSKKMLIRKAMKESTPQSAKVTSVLRDENYEMMEKRLNLGIEEMVMERRTVVYGYALRQQVLHIYEHKTKDVRDAKTFAASK